MKKMEVINDLNVAEKDLLKELNGYLISVGYSSYTVDSDCEVGISRYKETERKLFRREKKIYDYPAVIDISTNKKWIYYGPKYSELKSEDRNKWVMDVYGDCFFESMKRLANKLETHFGKSIIVKLASHKSLEHKMGYRHFIDFADM